MTRIALRDVHIEVARRREFKGNSIYAEWDNNLLYIVYSYGPHYPLAIWHDALRMWFVNDTRYSNTTARHRSSLKLHGAVSCTTEQMQFICGTKLGPAEIANTTNDLRDSVGIVEILEKVLTCRPDAFANKYEEHA